MEKQQVIELRDCSIYITESDLPYSSNGRLGVAIAIHATPGGEIYVSPTGSPMSGHAQAIYTTVYAPVSQDQ